MCTLLHLKMLIFNLLCITIGLLGQELNPAKWMEQTLMEDKGNYTLKDIVIPGSHDAGMSILTDVGGIKDGTINECNTLTQKINIRDQLQAGLRMFDLRIGTNDRILFTKHSSSDCVEEAIGAGYGEALRNITESIRKFITVNNEEIVLLTFSHFCEKETSRVDLERELENYIGLENIYTPNGIPLHEVTLKELSGKVVLLFENYESEKKHIINHTMADSGQFFLNFKRRYASTSKLKHLLSKEKEFFQEIKGNVNSNDIVKLDWQLTQSADEAAMVCNSFETENSNPLIGATVFLMGLIKGYKSIIKRCQIANKALERTLFAWIREEVITKENKPNILYVDVADKWVTELCVKLNRLSLYTKDNENLRIN